MSIAAALPWIIAGATAASTTMSVVSALKTPKMPEIKEQPSASSLEAAYAQSQVLRQRKGAASTILTGPQGITEPSSVSKTQLGA